jgi:hypothetical protein
MMVDFEWKRGSWDEGDELSPWYEKIDDVHKEGARSGGRWGR